MLCGQFLMTSSRFTELFPGLNKVHYSSSDRKDFTVVLMYGWGSTASRLEPLQGGSLPFTTKFPKIPGTHFIDLETMNG